MVRPYLGPILFFAFCIFGLLVMIGLGDALIPLLIAGFLAYLVSPLVEKLERRGMKRSRALASAIGLVLVPAVVILSIAVPLLFAEAKSFVTALPHIIEVAVQKIENLALQFDIELPLEKKELITTLKGYVSEVSVTTIKSAGAFFGKALSGAAGVLLAVLNLLLIPIFFIYVLHDIDKIRKVAREMIPAKGRDFFDTFIARASRIVSGYFRGQVLVALILGCMYGIGFWLVGLRFGFVIGFLTGVLNLIPYAGPVIGLATASSVGLANFESYTSVIYIFVVFGVIQGLEGFLITPKIVGDRVGLNALETMIVLIVGGNAAGLFGMLVAIPLGAILKFVLKDLYAFYLRTEFYSHSR